MPYGEKYDLENIEERRKQRLMERNINYKKMQKLMRSGDDSAMNYGFGVSVLIFIAAVIVYWVFDHLAGLFVLIIAVGVHLHWVMRWLYAHIVVAQLNHLSESPRVLRRLQPLREWSHEQIKQVFT